MKVTFDYSSWSEATMLDNYHDRGVLFHIICMKLVAPWYIDPIASLDKRAIELMYMFSIERETKICNPFAESEFFPIWKEFKDFRIAEKKGWYKSTKNEQIAADNLFEISGGRIDEAAEIVKQSIAHRWSGLFPLKNKQHGAAKITGTTSTSYTGPKSSAGQNALLDRIRHDQ